jgi:hypothetical protein
MMASRKTISHKRLIRWAAVAVVAALLLGVVTFATSDRKGNHRVTVQALWYGTSSEGQVVGGVTPVAITAVADDPDSPLAVDLRGLQAKGAGPMWTAATSVAAVQAVLESGVDPRIGQLQYSLTEEIDGPSAGALMTVGSLAAIAGESISDSITMTGTVLPDGSVGAVAGIPAKIRAAAKAGFAQVLIPIGSEVSVDPSTKIAVDTIEQGKSLGVQVTPVGSVPEAYAILTGKPLEKPEAASAPIDAQILQLLTARSEALIVSAQAQEASLKALLGGAASSEAAQAGSQSVETLIIAAQDALSQNDPVLAFAAASEASLSARRQTVSATLQAASARPLAELTAQVAQEAEESRVLINAEVRRTAEFPVTKIAQLAALGPTLAWGDFALSSINIVKDRLKAVTTFAELVDIAQFLEVAQFEAEIYMTADAESLQYLGVRPMSDTKATVDLLDAYVDLLNYAARSNRIYAESLGLETSSSRYLTELIRESGSQATIDAPETFKLRGPTAQVSRRLGVAMLSFVETTQLVNDLTQGAAGNRDEPPNLEPIKDQAQVRTEAETGRQIARSQVRKIHAAGLDPSSIQWHSQWGADLAFGRLPNTSDEQKLHGVVFQWFAVLQSRLLIALNGLEKKD